MIVCKCGHVHVGGACTVAGCACKRLRRAPQRGVRCDGCEHLSGHVCEIVAGGERCPVYPFKWSDEEYRRWISRVKLGSRPLYEKALELWIQFLSGRYGERHTPKTLIDQIEEDRRSARRQQGIVEDRLVAFYQWLTQEYTSKGVFGRGNRHRRKRGISQKRAHAYIMALRSFYRHSGFPIRRELLLPELLSTPPPRPQNQQHQFTMEEVRMMIDACTNLRDKALIAVKAQSLMDTSTLAFNFRYSSIIGGFKEGYSFPARHFLEPLIEALRSTQHPVHVRVERFKTGHVYDTFIGRDACRYLADYLQEKYDAGWDPALNDVIFTLYSYEGGVGEIYIKSDTRDVVAELFRRLVRKLGIVSDAVLESSDINPARPHALRGSIATLLREQINGEIVEYWMGHKISEKSLVYFLDLQSRRDAVQERDRVEKMRALYAKHEALIALS